MVMILSLPIPDVWRLQLRVKVKDYLERHIPANKLVHAPHGPLTLSTPLQLAKLYEMRFYNNFKIRGKLLRSGLCTMRILTPEFPHRF